MTKTQAFNVYKLHRQEECPDSPAFAYWAVTQWSVFDDLGLHQNVAWWRRTPRTRVSSDDLGGK